MSFTPLPVINAQKCELHKKYGVDSNRPEDRCHMCKGCYDWYEEQVSLKRADKFSPFCKLSSDIKIERIVEEAQLDIEDETYLSAILDPVEWARLELQWEARWYQSEILRCSSRLKLVRCGRRSGKSASLAVDCLHRAATNEGYRVLVITPYQEQSDMLFRDHFLPMLEKSVSLKSMVDRYTKSPSHNLTFTNKSRIICMSLVAGSKIYTKDGIKNIEDIQDGDVLLTLEEDSGRLVYSTCTEVHVPNYKHVYKVDIRHGHTVTVSDDHPFWTENGWVKLKDLTLGDKVATARSYLDFDQDEKDYTDDELFVLGCLIGDGTLSKAAGSWRFTCGNTSLQSRFEKSLESMQVAWSSSIHKRTGSKEYVLHKTHDNKYRHGKTNWNRLYEIVTKNNLHNKLSYEKCLSNDLLSVSKRQTKFLLEGLLATDGYISKKGNMVVQFCTTSRQLAQDFQHLLRKVGAKSYFLEVPPTTGAIIGRRESYRITVSSKYDLSMLLPLSIPGKDTSWMNEVISSGSDLFKIVKGAEFLTRFKEIKALLPKYQKPKTPSFLRKEHVSIQGLKKAADLLGSYELHNLADKLWEDGPAHIEFNEIVGIKKLPKQTTYDITVEGTGNFIANDVILHNTAGVKSGSASGKIRGQDANHIAIDEADTLARDDLQTIVPIIVSHPEVTMWISGTPTGKREFFYQWATNAREPFKKFHFPAKVSPSWNSDMEEWLKNSYSDSAYLAEFEADFPVLKEGVFPAKLIDESIQDYDPEMLTKRSDWVYGLGVDWNDTDTGAAICLVGYNPADKKFWFVRKWEISRENFSQLAAVEEILKINGQWDPSFIYVDAGFGTTQTELLHKYGIKKPSTKLHTKVVAIDMGAKTEIHDPYLGMTRKYTKPLIVGLATRRFEQEQIVLPRCEQTTSGMKFLINQLLGYRILRYTNEGRPIYSKEDDHMLTAYLLALYGFYVKHTELVTPNAPRTIGVVPPPILEEEEKEPDFSGLPFSTIKFEVPKERQEEIKKEKRDQLLPRSRSFDIDNATSTMADISELSKARVGRAPIRPAFGAGRTKPVKRSTF